MIDLDAIKTRYAHYGKPKPNTAHADVMDLLSELQQLRCPSCDHAMKRHSKGGCWYTVTTGAGRDLTCPCTVVAGATN